jgi:hypothetical protein
VSPAASTRFAAVPDSVTVFGTNATVFTPLVNASDATDVDPDPACALVDDRHRPAVRVRTRDRRRRHVLHGRHRRTGTAPRTPAVSASFATVTAAAT